MLRNDDGTGTLLLTTQTPRRSCNASLPNALEGVVDLAHLQKNASRRICGEMNTFQVEFPLNSPNRWKWPPLSMLHVDMLHISSFLLDWYQTVSSCPIWVHLGKFQCYRAKLTSQNNIELCWLDSVFVEMCAKTATSFPFTNLHNLAQSGLISIKKTIENTV